MEFSARLLVDCQNQLGECVRWHAERQRVFWTDILESRLWSCDQDGGDLRSIALEERLCAFAFTSEGRFLAGFADGICWMDPDTGVREMITAYMPNHPTTRMNDGALDRQGRFIIGGIEEASMEPVTPVWSLGPDGVGTVIEGVGCANSIAFSPDGGRMYFADSAGHDIETFDYQDGIPTDRRVFATLTDEEGHPDGSTVDAAGGLWNAGWNGSAVQRFTPEGVRDIKVSLPCPQVTCCAIGGTDMRRLFITSARVDMSDEQLEAAPLSGGLFAVDIPFDGIPEGVFAGL